VRIQWREDKDPKTLKVQIILRVQRPRPEMPDPAESVLCFVDVNSAYGMAVVIAAYDGERVKVFETPKFRPLNQGRRLRETAKKMRAAAYGSKPNVNYALARLTEKFDASGWVKAAAAEIFKKAMKYAKGRSILMNFDIPDSETVKGSSLQRTLLSIRKVAENLAKWYGVYAEFRCFPSRRCPLCGGRLKELRTKRTRIEQCRQCNFVERARVCKQYRYKPRDIRVLREDEQAGSCCGFAPARLLGRRLWGAGGGSALFAVTGPTAS